MDNVLIVGAGPTGLVLAYELTRRGIPMRIIDEKQGPSIYSKALGIQARTLELFEKMGIIEPFLTQGLHAKEIVYHWNHRKIKIAIENLDTPFPFVLILPQSATEKILLGALETIGQKVEWETQFVTADDNGVTLKHPNGEVETYNPQWIVGCDGAHSSVRHVLQAPFVGGKFPELFILADVQAQTSLKIEGPTLFFNRQGLAAIFPHPEKGVYRLIFPAPYHSTEEITVPLLSQLLQARGVTVPFEIQEARWVSHFHIYRRISTFMQKGNIFLAGDAAHIHSPIGGQGMNTSIQDAFNLAWKLELVIKKGADKSFLKSYELERHPIAHELLKGTTSATNALLFLQKLPLLLYGLILVILKQKRMRQKILYRLSQLSVHYRKSPLAKEPKKDKKWQGPKAGDRMPDCVLEDGIRLFEYLKSTKFVLFLFSEYPELDDLLKQEYGQWIDIHILHGDKVREKLKADTRSLYFVRPDGYIGYRSRSFQQEELILYIKNNFNF